MFIIGLFIVRFFDGIREVSYAHATYELTLYVGHETSFVRSLLFWDDC